MTEFYPFHLVDRIPNPYGFGGIDRQSFVRQDDDWFQRLSAIPNIKILIHWQSKSMISEAVAGSPNATIIDFSEAQLAIEAADSKVFFGAKDGENYVGIDISNLNEEQAFSYLPGGAEFRDLREVGPILNRFDACILAYSRAVFYWHQRNKFCGVCGSETRINKAGHQIDCNNHKCGQPVFPRTDPAVIMLVHDGNRALLGRQKVWKRGMYSTLAGFLEPGETLEEAVAREVFEEANIEIESVRYHSSQPWPFPSSIMLGFFAKARSTFIRRNDEEVEDVQWFTKDELNSFSSLEKSLPRTDSIARRLIEDWLLGKE